MAQVNGENLKMKYELKKISGIGQLFIGENNWKYPIFKNILYDKIRFCKFLSEI